MKSRLVMIVVRGLVLGLLLGAGQTARRSAYAQERGGVQGAGESASVRTIDLERGVLRDPSRLPTSATREIGDALPRDPLAHGAWYRARFRARDANGPIDISWTFSTAAEPFPSGAD